jgi:signal transduction histidine kinase
MSRVDTGSTDLSLDEVEVGELARQMVTAGGARGIRLTVDPAVSDLRLWVDKRRIDRVLTNLVDNAGQYAGGATGLSVEAGDPPGSRVRLIVSDRGPGVAPEERQQIFERFYRGQAAGQRGATEGTGLGLALVAEHVRLHGGTVWVEDGPDGENRFVIDLPAHRDGETDMPTSTRRP